jgi:membrane-associated phospholipid phosphatase
VGGEREPEQRIARVLEEGLKRIDSPQAAHAVVTRLERMSAGRTEAEAGKAAAEEIIAAPEPDQSAAAATVERCADALDQAPEHAVADVLQTVAEQSVAPTPAAGTATAAAQATLKPRQPVDPNARRGRRLLKQAVLQRMGPLSALDARIYLALNEAPHPGVLDSLGWIIAVLFTGGWIWVIGTLVAYLLRVPRSWVAVKTLLPSVVIATWTIEYPIKAFFRRRRPFVQIVQALVIGKKPGSWSFPSGHTGASFASAWILSSIWPKGATGFFGIASTVGFSRVYVGAHYPGDVASGAILGMLLSEAVRRLVRWLLRAL